MSGEYPKTLVNSNDPTDGTYRVVHTLEEEEKAKKDGFGGAYKPQDYPKMLYRGKVQSADTEQDPKTCRQVNNPDEEAEANAKGFKSPSTKKAKE